MISLFTTGGLLIDNVVAADGVVSQGMMGGNAIYSAAGARLWMEGVGMVALIPENYPVAWLSRVAETGIDLAGVTMVAEAVMHSEWFFYRADGSRADHLHARHDSLTAARLDSDEALAFEALLRARETDDDFGSFRRRNPVLPEHVPDSYRTARGAHLAPNVAAAQQRLLDALATGDRKVTLDPGAQAAALEHSWFAQLAALLPSEKELAVLAPKLCPEAALDALAAAGAPICVAKLGGAGSLIRTPRGLCRVPPVKVSVQDPTGAGDAYCGGFLAGLLLTGDAVQAARYGTVSASFAVEAFGPFHLLEASRAEAARRLVSIVPLRLSGTIDAL